MNVCADIRAQLAYYLDDELTAAERAAIEIHLKRCRNCRDAFNLEQRFFRAIRDTQPRYSAPFDLRTKIATILRDAPGVDRAPPALRQKLQRVYGHFGWAGFPTPIAATILLCLLAGIWLFTVHTDQRHRAASNFASTAVEFHQRHLYGQLPLDLTSDRPAQISAWFADKLPFKLELPNYQDSSGEPKHYEIEGARLVDYKDNSAAYVVYRMAHQQISLLVTSRTAAQPSGGEEIFANSIAFHHDSINGFRVITWSHRGLTYALVSAFDSPAQQSCLVCHEGNRNFLDDRNITSQLN